MSNENENPNKRPRISEEIDDIGVEHGGAKDSLGFKFKYTPKKTETGVDEAITRLSAAMSGQMYCAEKIEDYDLSQNGMIVEAVLFDNKDKLKNLCPYFAVAVTGDKMLLGWRGTTDDIMNVFTDINVTPATSARWAHISPDLKVHGGFLPIIENDFCTHESTLIKLMEQYGITEVITTGHSLGGGLATVAHLAIEGELMKESIWKDYAEKLKGEGKEFKVRTIAFSAPSSIFDMSTNDSVVSDFLKKIEANACNIIYSTDPVPHLPCNMNFLNELVDELVPEVTANLKQKLGFVGRLGGAIVNIDDLGEKFVTNVVTSQRDLLITLQISRHYCKIIQYENDVVVPSLYKDYGKDELGEPDGIKNFRSIKWQETPDVVGLLMHNHNITVRGPGLGYNIDEEKVEVKLYHMHNRSLMEDEEDVAKVRVNGWEDCRKKAKENFVYAYMGGYVDWDDEPKHLKPHERGGLLHVKENIARASDDAKWVKSRGLFGRREVKHTALWRTPALADKIELARK